MRGEKVIARAFGGVPVVLRVWETGQNMVYLASDVEFEKRQAGKEAALEPIGFPASDVFAYDESVLTTKKPDWRKLKPWRPIKLATQ